MRRGTRASDRAEGRKRTAKPRARGLTERETKDLLAYIDANVKLLEAENAELRRRLR